MAEAAETTCSDNNEREQVEKILYYYSVPSSRNELQNFVGITGRKAFVTKYLKALLESGKLTITVPDKPNRGNQKYVSSKSNKNG